MDYSAGLPLEVDRMVTLSVPDRPQKSGRVNSMGSRIRE